MDKERRLKSAKDLDRSTPPAQKQWWEERYVKPDGVTGYLATYRDIMTPEISQAEVISALAMPTEVFNTPLADDDPILDGFCGTGRHAVEALGMGFNNWTLFDYSEEMLARAGKILSAHFDSEQFTLSQEDARDLSFPDEQFRYYQILGNSALGFFDNPSDDRRVLEAAGRVLQPEGFVVFDLTDHDYAVAQLTEHTLVRHEQDGTVIRQRTTGQQAEWLRTGHTEYRFGRYLDIDPDRKDVYVAHDKEKDSIIVSEEDRLVEAIDAASVDVQSVGRRVYTTEQIRDMMNQAGFDAHVAPKEFNYEDTTDRFGTMGVRNLFIGQKQ